MTRQLQRYTFGEDAINAQQQRYQQVKQSASAIYNPVDKKVHIEDRSYGNLEKSGKKGDYFDWTPHPWVMDTTRYGEGKAKLRAGSYNLDQAQYNFINDEFLDDAIEWYDSLRMHGAGTLTSTEFPAFTTVATETALVNLEQLARVQFNLLAAATTINTDQIYLRFPTWDDTTSNVKVGYREGDPIDTISWGAMSETQLTIEKAGVGWAMTEEYNMRRGNFTFPVENIILNKIAFEFTMRRHEQLVAGLPTFTDLSGSDWGAYTAGNLASTNRPQIDLNAAKAAIMAGRRARPDIIISTEATYIDYYTNTWTQNGGLNSAPQPAGMTDANDVVPGPATIPWCRRWYLNEDVTAGSAFVIDSQALAMIEGPSKTTTGMLINPDETMEFRKQWFKFYIRDANYGRQLTGVNT